MSDIISNLERLHALLQNGVLTPEEFAVQKAKLLNGPTPAMPQQMSSQFFVGAVFRDYQLYEAIGQGGMGTVFKVRHRNQEIYQAQGYRVLKVIHAEFANDERFRQNFVSEAAKGILLNHSGIAKVYDLYDEADVLAILMEYIEGDDLSDAVILSTGQVLHILEALSDVLDFIHSKGIIHRDIKPENLKIHATRGPVLLDFGIAKDLSMNQKKTLLSMGTPLYMAPEQLDGRSVTGASDQYALALMVYILLSGFFPWEEGSDSRISMIKLSGKLFSLKQVADHFSDEVSNVLMTALSVQPEDRFASCSDFYQHLYRAFDNEKGNEVRNVAKAESVGKSIQKTQIIHRKDHADSHHSDSKISKNMQNEVSSTEDHVSIETRHPVSHSEENIASAIVSDQSIHTILPSKKDQPTTLEELWLIEQQLTPEQALEQIQSERYLRYNRDFIQRLSEGFVSLHQFGAWLSRPIDKGGLQMANKPRLWQGFALMHSIFGIIDIAFALLWIYVIWESIFENPSLLIFGHLDAWRWIGIFTGYGLIRWLAHWFQYQKTGLAFKQFQENLDALVQKHLLDKSLIFSKNTVLSIAYQGPTKFDISPWNASIPIMMLLPLIAVPLSFVGRTGIVLMPNSILSEYLHVMDDLITEYLKNDLWITFMIWGVGILACQWSIQKNKKSTASVSISKIIIHFISWILLVGWPLLTQELQSDLCIPFVPAAGAILLSGALKNWGIHHRFKTAIKFGTLLILVATPFFLLKQQEKGLFEERFYSTLEVYSSSLENYLREIDSSMTANEFLFDEIQCMDAVIFQQNFTACLDTLRETEKNLDNIERGLQVFEELNTNCHLMHLGYLNAYPDPLETIKCDVSDDQIATLDAFSDEAIANLQNEKRELDSFIAVLGRFYEKTGYGLPSSYQPTEISSSSIQQLSSAVEQLREITIDFGFGIVDVALTCDDIALRVQDNQSFWLLPPKNDRDCILVANYTALVDSRDHDDIPDAVSYDFDDLVRKDISCRMSDVTPSASYYSYEFLCQD